MFHSSEIVVI